MSLQDPILDAARATVLDFGVGRATVSEVARRAGVSRMTVYRRHPDGAALLRALMAREFAAVLEQAERETAWLGTGLGRAGAGAGGGGARPRAAGGERGPLRRPIGRQPRACAHPRARRRAPAAVL